MIYRVNIKNKDNWTDTVYVEALNMDTARDKVIAEFPDHRITTISEDQAIAIIT